MSDISASNTPPPSEVPPPGGAPRYDAPDSDRRSGAFETALRDADGHARAADADPDDLRADRRDEDDDDGEDRKHRGGGESEAAPRDGGGLQALLGRAKLQDASDPTAGLAALAPHVGGQAAAGEAEAASAPGGPDLQVFAQMLEDAAARAPAAPGDQAIQVTFNDARTPLEGVAVARLPDGSLSMTLQATAGAVGEISRSLEALRRRLEARGVALGELKMAEEGSTGPVAVAGADGA